MEVGTAEVALAFSGVMCVVGVLTFFNSSKERERAEDERRAAKLDHEHDKDLETHKWRTEARGILNKHTEELSTIKCEQRELRDEMQENRDRIGNLSHRIETLSTRHDTDIKDIEHRIESDQSSVNDLMDVMRSNIEMEEEDK